MSVNSFLIPFTPTRYFICLLFLSPSSISFFFILFLLLLVYYFLMAEMTWKISKLKYSWLSPRILAWEISTLFFYHFYQSFISLKLDLVTSAFVTSGKIDRAWYQHYSWRQIFSFIFVNVICCKRYRFQCPILFSFFYDKHYLYRHNFQNLLPCWLSRSLPFLHPLQPIFEANISWLYADSPQPSPQIYIDTGY